MDFENKVASCGFFTPQLKIQILDTWILKNDCLKPISEMFYYKITYFRKGSFYYSKNNKRIEVDSGTIIIGKYDKSEAIKTNMVIGNNYEKTEVVTICVYPTLFQQLTGDSDFFRAFEQASSLENCIYSISDFEGFDIENYIFSSIDKYINKNMGLIHYSALVCTLITEINIVFDKKEKLPFSTYSDEYEVKVFDYIVNNFMTDITVESVAKKFSVSKFYVDKVTKRFYSKSFHKAITNMRIWHARKLMKENSNLFLLDICKLCGYKDYSGFYKAYSSFFGVSPKKDYNCYKHNGKFLSYKYE